MRKKPGKKDVQENAVTRKGERLAVLQISVPVHGTHTSAGEALRLVYSEALTSGAGKYSRESFTDALALLGASLAVRAGDDTVLLSLHSSDTMLRKTLNLLTVMLTAPTFTERELKRIKEHITNAISLAKEDARGRAYQEFVNALVPEVDRRYQTPLETLTAQVKKVTTKSLRGFHKEIFKYPWVHTCGGSEESVVEILRSVGKLHKHAETRAERVSATLPPLTNRKVLLIDIPHKQNIEFSIGGVLPLYPTDPEYRAFSFGMSVLGLQGGFSGRLMSTVREKEGLTYGIYGKPEKATKTEQGFWRIMTFFNPKDAVRGITSTLHQVEEMQEQGITEDELRRFKAIIETRIALREDSLLRKVAELQSFREAGLTEAEYELYRKDIASMTVARVNSAMKKYLDPKKIVISGAGPISTVRKDLEKFAI